MMKRLLKISGKAKVETLPRHGKNAKTLTKVVVTQILQLELVGKSREGKRWEKHKTRTKMKMKIKQKGFMKNQ